LFDYSASPIYIVIAAFTEEVLAISILSVPPSTHFKIGHDGRVAVHVDGGYSGVHISNVAYIASPVDKVIASV